MPGPEPPAGGGGPVENVSTCTTTGISAREQVTPHRLCVVLLVREYCQYKASLVSVTPGERTSLCLLVLSLVQEPDLDLSTMCSEIESVVPSGLSTAWAQGIARLQSEGVAGVMDLVQSIEKLLASETGATVSRSSVLGLLLRRVYLTFDKLTFSEVSALRQQLDWYYLAGRNALASLLQEEDGEQSGDMVDMSLDCDSSSIEFRLPSFLSVPESAEPIIPEQQRMVSRKQADLVIAQQASLLQTAESAALSPRDLQDEVSRILKSCPALPEAHFLSYLNCLRVNDVAGAEHALYASFAQVLCQLFSSASLTI